MYRLWTVLYQCVSCTVLQPLYIKLKGVPKKNWGRGPLPTGLLLVLSFLTDISMSAVSGCNSLVTAICLYGHYSNDMHFLKFGVYIHLTLTGCCFLCANIIG